MGKHLSFLVTHAEEIELRRRSTNDTQGFEDEESSEPALTKYRGQLSKLQEVLYAGQQKAVLIVLQGMDAAGKDGTIRHIFTGINPQGCAVSAFKMPTPLESRHDFLWRVHQAVPPRGIIGIFNRSHYEDVLSPRVHKHISAKVARERLKQIVEFERTLYENGVEILKFFLHISRDEQTARLKERLDDSGKHWKLSESDFEERKFWPEYQAAYEEILSETSRKFAPWYVIPSDHKWFRNVAISRVLVERLDSLKLCYPKPSFDPSKVKL